MIPIPIERMMDMWGKDTGFQTGKNKNTLSVIITLLGLTAIAGAFVYCLIRASRGISSSEESFYVSIPFRLVLGDHLAADEWHVTQLASLFQLLPVKLFMAATNSTEGIILFLRYFYLACLVLTVLLVVLLLPKENKRIGIAYSVFLCMYLPFAVLDLNYHTAYILSFTLVGIILFSEENPGKQDCFLRAYFWRFRYWPSRIRRSPFCCIL